MTFAPVALLAEGVDRNHILEREIETDTVALLAEGVDRNISGPPTLYPARGRPPRGGRG